MSPEMYAVGVPLIGVVLQLLGVGLAIRGGSNTAPHEAKLGPFGVTTPGPGITIALLGTLLVLAPRIVDLDRGRLVDGPDLDQEGELFLSAPGQLAPLTPYRMTVGDASSLPGCAEALEAYNDPGLTLDDPQHGGEFCMTTSEGAVAGVVVESWDPQSHQLELAWTLWPR